MDFACRKDVFPDRVKVPFEKGYYWPWYPHEGNWVWNGVHELVQNSNFVWKGNDGRSASFRLRDSESDIKSCSID